MKLVFYSGGQTDLNARMHEHLFRLTKRKFGTGTLSYIPFCSDGAHEYFWQAEKRYKRYGFQNVRCFPIDRPLKATDRKELLKSDAIYLAGGNTFYFLHHLRKSRLLTELRDFAKKGGVLSGLSAGAIMMTPNIQLASYPDFDKDDNDVGIKDLRSLNLVKFEFFPHFTNSKRFSDALRAYSIFSKYPVYAVPDGQGIVVEGNHRTFYGKTKVFYKGQELMIL